MYIQALVVVFLFNHVHCYTSYRRPINTGALPGYFDWRDVNAVSPVKDQGTCKACWAFSAVANIESHAKIYLREEVVLSEQFLIDCEVDGTGCSFTTILKAFAQITSVFGGVLKDSDYFPYSEQAEECRWNKLRPMPFPVVGFRRVLSNETVMVEYLYRYGPLSAAINSASMVNNVPGTIDEPDESQCSSDPRHLNHAILIVGYNAYVDRKTGKSTPYWIIKNSWGLEF